MKIIGGSSSLPLAAKVAVELDVPYVPAVFEKSSGGFPDGEQYVRLQGDVAAEHVVILASTRPDRLLIELLLLQDAARHAGAREVTSFIPYFSYARQDKVFETGEALSARAVARAVGAHSDRVLTLGMHNRETLRYFPCPAEDVSGMPAIARYFRDRSLDLILAPDDGAIGHAEEIGKILGLPWDHLEKERIDAHTVRLLPRSVAVVGKRVGLVDEVISTGGTIATAAAHLRSSGATYVAAACLHGVFAGPALERLKACDDVACSDTVPGPMTKFTVAGEIAAALKRWR